MPPRYLKNILILLVVIAISLPAFYCNTPNEKNQSTAINESLWHNVYDTNAHYVGMQTCRGCHAEIYETFIKTGMGQSFDYATKNKSAATFDNHALVYDNILDYYYKPYWNNDSLYILEYRLEGKDTIHKRIQKVDYIIGSGQHTNSHIFNNNGYLHQAPITFYTQKGKWDLAPGFEKGANSRFSRLIESECMTCHNGYPDFVANSLNKYLSVKTGIDCERCHGPGSLHVADKQKGIIVDTSKTPDYTIVNPRRLSTELQNNICQRCHLQGIAVLNDGKTFFDFRPGMKLSEVMNVFMPQYKGAQDKMIMASHVERMKKSQCYVVSGKMSCITCHNPHISVKVTPQSQYTNACQSCHGSATQLHCTESLKLRNAKGDNCITCHMPKNGSIDIPHVAVTDHYIRKRPMDNAQQEKISEFIGLQCFNNDQTDYITKARAYMEFYERYTPNKGLLDSALYFLNKQANDEAKQKQNRDFIRAYFLLNDFQKVISYAAKQDVQSINDGWTAYRVGAAYTATQQQNIAVVWYKRSVEILPYALDFQSKYASCLLALNNMQEAKQVLQFILSQDPNYASANSNLGFLYMQEGNATMAYEYLSKANMLNPDLEQNLINLAVWYHNNNAAAAAKKTVQHLLKKFPANEQAQQMLHDLQ